MYESPGKRGFRHYWHCSNNLQLPHWGRMGFVGAPIVNLSKTYLSLFRLKGSKTFHWLQFASNLSPALKEICLHLQKFKIKFPPWQMWLDLLCSFHHRDIQCKSSWSLVWSVLNSQTASRRSPRLVMKDVYARGIPIMKHTKLSYCAHKWRTKCFALHYNWKKI